MCLEDVKMLSCYSLTEARDVMISSWPESSYQNIIDTAFLALPNLLLIYTVSKAGDLLEDMPWLPSCARPKHIPLWGNRSLEHWVHLNFPFFFAQWKARSTWALKLSQARRTDRILKCTDINIYNRSLSIYKGSQASWGVWREIARLVSRPCRRRRPSSLDDGGISGLMNLEERQISKQIYSFINID